jgi:hypothetical protein
LENHLTASYRVKCTYTILIASPREIKICLPESWKIKGQRSLITPAKEKGDYMNINRRMDKQMLVYLYGGIGLRH